MDQFDGNDRVLDRLYHEFHPALQADRFPCLKNNVLLIAARMESMILAGSLRAEDRIPSLRHSSEQHRVSMQTVMQACAFLENRCLIDAWPKSGFYVSARLANALREAAAASHKPEVSSLAGFASVLSMHHDQTDPTFVPLGAAMPGDDLLLMGKLGADYRVRRPPLDGGIYQLRSSARPPSAAQGAEQALDGLGLQPRS